MRKKCKIAILLFSAILFSMQHSVEAKYIFFYENKIAEMEVDRKTPTIEGVQEDGKYNHDIMVTYTDNTKVSKALYYYNSETAEFNVPPREFKSGTVFSEEGYYRIIVTDIYGNQTKIQKFLIDKTAPEIRGIANGVIYDLPPNIEYYDKYGMEKVEIILPEDLEIIHTVRATNNKKESDRTGHSITINISSKPRNVIEYKWYIKKEKEREYKLANTNTQESYTFENLEKNTKYQIYCMAITEEKSYMSNPISAATLEVDKIEITEITDTGFSYKVSGIPDIYLSIYFPTWTSENGQDDIIWYEQEIKNHECCFTVDYSNHGKQTGKYQTHIYGKRRDESQTRVFFQSTYVWIQDKEPEQEKETVAGKTEIIVTDTAGNSKKEEYYIDKIISMKYSSKDAYLRMKQILKTKMEECNDGNQEIKIKQSQLDNITKLEIYDYVDMNGEELLGLKYFRNLEYLDIHGSIGIDSNELAILSKLKYLDISNCISENKTYDLHVLSKLKRLEYLNTSGTKISNEESVKQLLSLKEWKK